MNKATPDFHDLVADLRETGEAFAVATVVRTVSVTSAKAGAKALIRADGEIAAGWIGGGCVKAAVRRVAQASISKGAPQLISIQPKDLLEDLGVAAGDEKNGIHFAHNGCPSEGTIDVFIEPVTPKAEIIIFGASPIACALSKQAAPLGYRTIVCCEEVEQALHQNAQQWIEPADLSPSSKANRFIIVATQGKGDEASLKHAVESDARYIAFVGSRKKMKSLREKLIAKGVDENIIDKVKAPAGLDIGAITPEEIALSILAEMTSAHRKSARHKDQPPL